MKCRDKYGRFVTGSVPWNNNRNMPVSARKKQSKTRKRLFSEGKLKVWNKDKRLSKTHVENLKKARIEFYIKNPSAAVSFGRRMRELWQNAELKRIANEKRIKTMRAATFRKRMSRIKLMQYKKSPSMRKRLSRIKTLQYENKPELRKRIDRIITAWWKEHPEARKKQSQRIKNFFIKNPEAFEEFLKHGKNPLKKHLRTRQGFLVRSKGEKAIADFLYENKIPCLYESFSLPITTKPYKGNICTPDFYIPSLNIFIEFYGGYPKAWKKKVLKNKLYRAHKIPVLGITPAELKDLDYYLLRQGEELSESRIAKEFKIKEWIRTF